MNTILDVKTTQLIHWFNAIRNLNDSARTRALDAFWDGQIDSKCWLVNSLNPYITNPGNIYIFGGWIGVLANLLHGSSNVGAAKIFSIDLDPWCAGVANTINKTWADSNKFEAVTSDMADYVYNSGYSPDVVINTSTEHVTQETYDIWWDNIPPGTLVVLQGNDYFDCGEHIRCTKNLSEFKRINYQVDNLFEGTLKTSMYTRFMTIGHK